MAIESVLPVDARIKQFNSRFTALRTERDCSEGYPRDLARFKVECCGATCIVRVSGAIDFSNSRALETALADVFRAHRGIAVVSFVDCTFADCSCLSVLIRQSQLFPARLVIAAPPGGPLKRLLDIALLNAGLTVYDGLRAAKLAISPEPPAALGVLASLKSSASPRFHPEFAFGGSRVRLVRS
jgi:anti-anti-sigma factor